jgi:drug/metabolite transporter superfamily protein YnfA
MPQEAPNSSGPGRGDNPMARAAAAVVLLQAVFVVVLSLVLAVEGFQPDTVDPLGAEILALIGVASGVVLGLLARGIAAGRRWARGPVVVIELICVPIAWNLVQNDRWYAGVPLGVAALAVLVLLATSGQLLHSED